jgi:hypothetical protein
MTRNEEFKTLLASSWDLVIFDEAKLSALIAAPVEKPDGFSSRKNSGANVTC